MAQEMPQQSPLETTVHETTTAHKLVAEFVGTLALIYVGMLVITVGTLYGGAHLVDIALAHGLAIAVMVSATMTISGGQLNPAVTIGLLVGRRISAMEAGLNVVAQVAGGLLGGYLALASIQGLTLPAGGGALPLGGVPDLAPGISVGTGILVEAILTFFLVFVVFGTGVNPAFGGRVGGLAIGLTVALDILAGGPITGAAMNPARWIGAAVPAAHYANAAVYFVGPLVGAVAAGALWGFFLLPREEAKPAA